MESRGAASAASGTPADTDRLRTPVCLVLGMAGSGKTTLVDALAGWLEDEDDITEAVQSLKLEAGARSQEALPADAVDAGEEPHAPRASDTLPRQSVLDGTGAYVINLDPAVYDIPYEPNIDIRDTVKYKDVMNEYSLGPNGAIITSLNLYATRFDQVLSLIEKRAPEVKAVLIDTPGQIETFTWSASGTIITDALGMVLPTVVVFVVDTKRCESAMTFVSNMLYACSIMYKTRLPMVVAFNKIDVISCKFAQAWMEDFDAFDAVLKEENFVGTLARSMAMALEEFYKTMRTVGVSAHTGEGLDELVKCVKDASEEYEREYRPAVEERKRARARGEQSRMEKQLNRFRQDAEDELGGGLRNGSEESENSEAEEPETRVEGDVEAVRLAKMRGEYVDEEEENRRYEEFVRRFVETKKEEE